VDSSPVYLAEQAYDATEPEPKDNGYGRARLRLGISGVGLWVVVSTALLASRAFEVIANQLSEGPRADALLVALLLALYVLVQFPLDWLGGYVVPKQFGRRVLPAKSHAMALLRGIAIHTTVLFLSAAILYIGGLLAGLLGAFVAGVIWVLCLAACRGLLARLVARLPREGGLGDATSDSIRTELIESSDEGFTGGITGLFSPRTDVLPAAWKERLRPAAFVLVKTRRETVIRTGAWHAGRLGAMAFTAAGLFLSLLLAGPEAAGTGVGVVETALWFTLWSFAGLLVLPTLSRTAIYKIDQQLINEGIDPEQFDQLTSQLDSMQDAEPNRSRWVERIFHPIPSVANRQSPARGSRLAFWDIARTSVYLGIGALSLLTRSVHCNVGRPALWVWLPTD